MASGSNVGHEWANKDSPVTRRVLELSAANLNAYRANPLLVVEHANIERATAQGGYGRRQLYELIQNGADELVGTRSGRIEVVLTENYLYCANEGDPLDLEGVDALLSSHISMKRGSEIGRFGLGFKSVLGVTNRPEFFSRTGSFKFDAGLAEARIREVVPGGTRTPVLRIAIPIEANEAAIMDPTFAELMSWAASVVRLPRTAATSGWLSDDIGKFPAEFLLFSPHVSRLVLIDRTIGINREIRQERDGDTYVLIEGPSASRWKVFQGSHKPSPAARSEAGELADRKELPLIWAVPLLGRSQRGRFWAFFPTEYETTLSGILNAPWKTNEDRQNLLTGVFNEELIEAAAALVVRSLPDCIDHRDVASYLDLLPGRGREAPQWADRLVTEKIYELAAGAPSLPDQLGRLQLPEYLRIHPAGTPRLALDAWALAPGRPVDWCHPSVETRERRARVEKLMEGKIWAATPASWLKILVGPGTPLASIAAIHVAALLLEVDRDGWRPDVEKADIVLTSDDRLVAAKLGEVFLPGAYKTNPNIALVHPELASDPTCRLDLSTLGIDVVEPRTELEALLDQGVDTWSDADWDVFWELARKVGEEAPSIIRKALGPGEQIHVRTRAGTYRPLMATLLPGNIVPDEGIRDIDVTIDVKRHAADLGMLRSLGATEAPTEKGGSRGEPWFGEFEDDCRDRYEHFLRDRQIRSRPQIAYLGFEVSSFAGPLEPLRHLSDEGRARFTNAVLELQPSPDKWHYRHSSQPEKYPRMDCDAPELWMIRTFGRLRTELGVRPVDGCVGPSLAELGAVLPVADCSAAAAAALSLPDRPDLVKPEQWRAALDRADAVDQERILGKLYATAVDFVGPPDNIWCRVGAVRSLVRTPEVAVVTKAQDHDALVEQGSPVVLGPDEVSAHRLVAKWGLKAAEQAVRRELFWAPGGDERPLVDVFPGMRLFLPIDATETIVIPCASLRYDVYTAAGRKTEELRYLAQIGRFYWLIGQEDRDLLRCIDAEFHLGLTTEDIDGLLKQRDDNALRQRLRAIRERDSLPLRLLEMVGRDAMIRKLPLALLRTAEGMRGSIDDVTIAELTLAVYGVDTLRAFREELIAASLPAPSQWTGGMAAREFVRDVGFPAEYAGFERARRDPLLEVLGPPDLPPFHDFQMTIASNVRTLLRGHDGLRGLLSLPTGAGKTRVAVQAIVESVKDGELHGPVLWIAQSDELCEQAVQSWSFVWRALGPRQLLSISRLWGPNSAVPVEEGTHVVVATVDKLQGCVADPSYAWLAEATCVIIDEAHESITPMFTKVLSWLGLEASRERCPLIGLTATPFRGTSERETERLVQRYRRRRLDHGVFGANDPYSVLQEMGVLARVNHQLLEGSTVELPHEELELLKRTRRLPTQAEERLGNDVTRNLTLLEAIRKVAQETTVLVFATSVDHAQTLAALLKLDGINAAAISGETDPGARRHYIEEFRAGRIRVLTNFAVLTQGFDAPAVGAVFMARPTFSPNLYQQMIGRGLRGPLNGGKEECLIVNVKDNFIQYQGALAFYQFEFLWAPRGVN